MRWQKKKLKYLVSCNNEVLPEKTNPDHSIEYVEISDVLAGSGIVNVQSILFKDAPSRARRIVKHGDVIVSTVRTYLKAIALIDTPPVNMVVSTGFAVIRPKELKPLFSKYLFSSEHFIEEVIKRSKGVSYPSITTDELLDIIVDVPSEKTQLVIGFFLENRCKKIDTAITKKQQLIDLLNEEKAAIINHAVTKGIDADAPMKQSGVEWLGDIPSHWEVKKLKYLVKNVQTGSTPPSGMDEYSEGGSFDWFTPADFKDDIILKDSKRKVTQRAVDDEVVKVFPPLTVLLVGIGATLGKIGLVDRHCSSNQQINSIQFHDGYSPYFGAFFLKSISEIIVSLANAATLAILNQSQTKDLLMVCPPVKEQVAIVDFINVKTSEVNKAIQRIEKEIELLKEYKTSLIYEVVTGKVKVDAPVEEQLEAALQPF